jgi:hypothetical protein
VAKGRPRNKWRLFIRDSTISPPIEFSTEHREALERAYDLPPHYTAVRIEGPHGERLESDDFGKMTCSRPIIASGTTSGSGQVVQEAIAKRIFEAAKKGEHDGFGHAASDWPLCR